jgi:hypothetical protein
MQNALSQNELKFQNIVWRGTGALSAENRDQGFTPAFLDTERKEIYLSRHANGDVATVHILDGLPEHLRLSGETSATASKAKSNVIAGFVRDGKFYTREEAAAWIKESLDDGTMNG